jgi:hypothetical protein
MLDEKRRNVKQFFIHLYITSQRIRSNVIYILFSIFYYRQKIYKDFEKENDGINGNKEISFDSSKKRDLLICVIMDI